MPSLKLISSPRRDVWTMPEKGPKHLTIAYIPLILSSAQVVKPLADAFNSRAMPTMPSDAKNRIVRHIHTHIITRIDCTLCVQNKPWLSLYRSLSHTYCSMVCIIVSQILSFSNSVALRSSFISTPILLDPTRNHFFLDSD